MRTAIDTNILSAIWSNEPATASIVQLLGEARRNGALILSPVVFAELHAYPGATSAFLSSFIADTGITADFHLEKATWEEAGIRFARYAIRRRQSLGSAPRRLIADFLVGAHALLQADQLFTLDSKVYQQDFPELALVPLP